jgi:hypothetical protein
MAGDVGSAKRNLNWLKSAVDGRQFHDFENLVAKTEAALVGLSDEEKAPIAAELAELRKRGDEAIRADKLKRVLDEAGRNLRWAKEAVGNGHFEHAQGYFAKTETILAPLADADKAALAAQLAELRSACEGGGREEKKRELIRFMEGNLGGVRGGHPGDANLIQRVIEVLESEKGKEFLDAATIEDFRGRIAKLREDDASQRKQDLLAHVESILKRVEDNFARHPGLDRQSLGAAFDAANSSLVAARKTLEPLAASDSAVAAAAGKIAAFESRLAQAIAGSARQNKVGELVTHWNRLQEQLSGWQAESGSPGWEEYTVGSGRQGLDDLLLPKTVAAIHGYSEWLNHPSFKAIREEYRDDPEVAAISSQAAKLHEDAAEKLHHAFGRLMDEAESLASPTDEAELEKTKNRLVDRIDRWFAMTAYADINKGRAARLHDKWVASVAAYKEEGLNLYRQLSAEADARWPAIEMAIGAEEGFDPVEAEKWRGRTVKLGRVYNRIGWDYNSDYSFATNINGVPVAGNYTDEIRQAVRESYEKTRNSLDEHTAWDIIGVVQGPGTINRRNRRQLLSNETRSMVEVESWDPTPCVMMRIIGLHAGPVAVGSQRPKET